jgi:hypothetical protein
MTEKKTTWLSRRLKEIGKTKLELANKIGCNATRLTELEYGVWNFQINQIKPSADFLEFDRMAFLDFISGDISEEQLWNTKPITITEQDIAILQAVKSVAGLQKQAESNPDTSKQDKLLQKNTSR